MLITFFDVRGMVHSEFLPQGQTINQQVYKEILRRLLHSVHEKRRELWQDKSWLLHQDNAPADNALNIRQFLEQPPIHLILLRVTFSFPRQAQGDHQGDPL